MISDIARSKLSEPKEPPPKAPPGVHQRGRDDNLESKLEGDGEKKRSNLKLWKLFTAFSDKQQRGQLVGKLKSKAPRKEHIAQDTLSLIGTA
jgi:hypothetical protein